MEEADRAELLRWSRRASSAQSLALRSKIVLACAEGLDNKSVAARLGCAQATVGKWRARFVDAGLDGLLDEPRPGRTPTVTAEQVEDVIVTTLEASHPDRARRPGLAQPPTARRRGCRDHRLPTPRRGSCHGDRPDRLRPANGDARRRMEGPAPRPPSQLSDRKPLHRPRRPRLHSGHRLRLHRLLQLPADPTTPRESIPRSRPTPGHVTTPPCACSPSSTAPLNSATSSSSWPYADRRRARSSRPPCASGYWGL